MAEERPNFHFEFSTPNLGALGITIPPFKFGGRVNLPTFEKPELSTVDAIKKRFRLGDRAKRDGRRGIPQAGSEQVSSAERDVVGYFRQARNHVISRMRSNCDRGNQYLLQPPPAPINAEHVKAATSLSLDARITHPLWPLKSERRRSVMAARSLKLFRNANQILRPTKDRREVATELRPLFLAWMLEGAGSAILIAAGVHENVLVALLVAYLLSALNTLLGIALGFSIFRMVDHRDWRVSVAALAGSGCAIALVLGYNLTVARFRDNVAASGWDSAGAHIDQLWSASGGLFGVSTEGLAISLIGVLSFAYAAYKGRAVFADDYVGYEQIDALRERREWIFERDIEGRRQYAEKLLNTVLEQIAVRRAAIQESIAQAEEIEQAVRHLTDLAPAALGSIRDDCRSAIEFYREDNLFYRKWKSKEGSVFDAEPEMDVAVNFDLSPLTRNKDRFLKEFREALAPTEALFEAIEAMKATLDERIETLRARVDAEIEAEGEYGEPEEAAA